MDFFDSLKSNRLIILIISIVINIILITINFVNMFLSFC